MSHRGNSNLKLPSMINKFISAHKIRILTFQNIKFQVLSGRCLRLIHQHPFGENLILAHKLSLAEVEEHYRSVHTAIQKS